MLDIFFFFTFFVCFVSDSIGYSFLYYSVVLCVNEMQIKFHDELGLSRFRFILFFFFF